MYRLKPVPFKSVCDICGTIEVHPSKQISLSGDPSLPGLLFDLGVCYCTVREIVFVTVSRPDKPVTVMV